MATHNPTKNAAIKPCMIFVTIAAAVIVFITIFFEGMAIKGSNQVSPPSNFKLVENKNQFGSNSIQKPNEIPKSDEVLKLPANIGDLFNNGKPVTFKKVDQLDKD